tara:strand:+ start:476 stop:1225 length:750 start_codon:yes stop_codon:yes gene_type:complete
MLISADTIVLRKIIYGESSLIVRLFSRDNGKISVMAKGARRPKSNFSSILEPMNLINIQYIYKNSRKIQLLKSADLNENLINIRDDFNSLQHGLTIVDIMDKATIEGDSSELLYRLCKSTLVSLNFQKGHCSLIFTFFLIQLSIHSGFMPHLKQCSECFNKLDDAIVDLTSGNFYCRSCSKSSKKLITKDAINLFEILSKTHINNIYSIKYNSESLVVLNSFLDWYLGFHINSTMNLKSIKMLRDITNG